jgi:glycosyltransferase involved in cell wall biosynthesis
VDGNFEKLVGLKKRMWKYVFKNASSYHAVSLFLADNIKNKLGLKKNGIVIPNVVDAALFYYNNQTDKSAVTFAHVSNMSFQKNVEGMLQGFAEVKKISPNFILNLVGPMQPQTGELINDLQLSQQVTVWGERDYKEVAAILQQSNAFVFFTRYETFGCVIIEANACGLPVIISDLEVTRELITENFNGIFVESENVNDLAEKILFTMQNLKNYDPLAISVETRNKYNYQRISKQFIDWYKRVGLAR